MRRLRHVDPKARLEALPWARSCVGCAERNAEGAAKSRCQRSAAGPVVFLDDEHAALAIARLRTVLLQDGLGSGGEYLLGGRTTRIAPSCFTCVA